MSDFFRPHGLWPARLLCPWSSPGKNTGVDCHFLLQGSTQPRDWTQVSHIADSSFPGELIKHAAVNRRHRLPHTHIANDKGISGPKCQQYQGGKAPFYMIYQQMFAVYEAPGVWRKLSHSKDWSWSSNTLTTWCGEPTRWKRPWCSERLKARGEGDDRGWGGQMASPTQWTWVWADFGRWWRTGKPGMLQSMGLQRVGQNWATEQQQSWSPRWEKRR